MKKLLLFFSYLFLLSILSFVGYVGYIYVTEEPAKPNWHGYMCNC